MTPDRLGERSVKAGVGKVYIHTDIAPIGRSGNPVQLGVLLAG